VKEYGGGRRRKGEMILIGVILPMALSNSGVFPCMDSGSTYDVLGISSSISGNSNGAHPQK
jgi:hypothetical protein